MPDGNDRVLVDLVAPTTKGGDFLIVDRTTGETIAEVGQAILVGYHDQFRGGVDRVKVWAIWQDDEIHLTGEIEQ